MSQLAKNIARYYASGKSGRDITEEINQVRIDDYMPMYYRAVVLDVIFDPLVLDQEDLNALGRIVKWSYQVDSLPRNAIIGQLVASEGETAYMPEIFFPFFSSHLSLPLNAGEQVWVMFEDHSKPIDYGFWLSRIHEPRHVEDANFCHGDRRWIYPNANPTSTMRAGGITNNQPTPLASFPVGVGGGSKAGNTLPYQDATGNYLASNTDAYAIIDETARSASPGIVGYEATPRFTKRPGDLCLQGSNNTLISLGQKREPHPVIPTELGDRAESTSNLAPATANFPVQECGAIDIVVGRGRTGRTGCSVTHNSRGREEADLSTGAEPPNEGDPDFENDAARVYMSMSTSLDDEFKLEFTDQPSATDNRDDADKLIPNEKFGEQAGIAVKADEVRIIARRDIKFIVYHKDAEPVDGVYKESDFSSITLNTQG